MSPFVLNNNEKIFVEWLQNVMSLLFFCEILVSKIFDRL